MTDAEFERRLNSLSCSDCLLTLSKLNRDLAERALRTGHEDHSIDLELANQLTEGRTRAVALIQSMGSRLASPASVTTLAREAVVRAADRPADGFSGASDFGLLVDALAGVFDLYDPGGDGEPSEDELTSFMLRRVARPQAIFAGFVARYWRMLVEIPGERPELLAGFDLAARASSILEIELVRYFAIAFGIWSRFATAGGDPSSWELAETYFTTTTNVTAEEFKTVARSVSRTVDELRALYEAEFAAGRREIDHNVPAMLYPLVEVTAGRYVPIDYSALGDRLVGDGLFWRLRPRVHESDGDAFGAAIGALLEEHLWNVMRSVYPRFGIDRLFRQARYGRGHDGPDITLFDDGCIAIIEVGGNRVRAIETLVEGDVSAFDREIDEMLTPRAEQIHRKIDAYRSGELSFAGHPNSPHATIWPVVCFADGFPLGPFLRQRIDARLSEQGLLTQPNVARISILSAEDLELASAVVEGGANTFTGLLRDHALSNTADFRLREHILISHRPFKFGTYLDGVIEASSARMIAELSFSA